MEGKLIFQWKGGTREVPLVRASYTVGRDPSCEVAIDDESLSRRHAEFRVEGEQVLVKDLGSRNGTWVDAQRIKDAVPVTAHTDVRLGVVQVRLMEGGKAALSPIVARSDKTGKVLAVLSQKGGTGKTFVAVNLAIALRQESDKSVCLVDMSLPFSGDVMVLLNIPSARGISDLLRQNFPVAADTIPMATTEHASGISVVPVSLHAEAVARLQPRDIAILCDSLRQSFDYVVVDCGGAIDALSLEVLDRAALILTILVPELMAVNQGRKTLEYLTHLLYPKEMIQIALNRHTAESKIQPRLVELNLKKECSYVIPEDAAVAQSVLTGAPLTASSPKHPITRTFRGMARDFMLREVQFAKGDRHGLRRESADGSDQQKAAIDAPQPFQKSKEILELKRRIHTRLIEESNLRQLDLEAMTDQKKTRELRLDVEKKINKLIDEEAAMIPSKEQRVILSRDLLNEALGLGPIEYLLADSRISEIMVNGSDKIYVEQGGKIILTDFCFSSEKHLRRIIERIVQPGGRRIDEKTPMVDTKLLDGSRVNAIIPPLALNGSVLTIRKFSKVPLGVPDLIRFGTLSLQMAKFLEACVLVRRNIIISGGTGSGKTTLLNILSCYIPTDERIVTIEDAAELQLQQEHVVRLETRPANIEGEGEVNIRDLVKNSLRMRPDRIVVGECRSGEALDMLQAMNTGHDGSLTTVHANAPRDALSRLETLSLMSGLDLPSRAIRDQISSAINVVVQQSRLADGSRKVTHITEITGMEGDTFTMQDIFRFVQTGVDAQGKVIGKHEPTGFVPSFLPLVTKRGLDVPREIFLRQTA
ncbi:MAG: ATPase, T2SS/T4P/T4SS family [Acidobacteriota bacterium]